MRIYSLIWTLIIIAANSALLAQISPGPLSQAHSHLEGISNCTKCHDIGNKVPDSKCLECHDEISSLIDLGRGYHASPEVTGKSCIKCHSEHHGTKFDMVRFDEEAFDHDLTGYPLQGQHAVIDCRDCHMPDNISSPEIRKREDTYLGLDDKCLSCHDDFHQNTLSKDCASCHDFEAFRPASLFTHDETEFPLRGKHQDVNCLECHEKTQRNGREFQVFSGVDFSDCVSCHDDAHKGNLPGSCASCHDESSFDNFSGRRSFNHKLTNFELRGKHRTTDCFDCHKNTFNAATIFQDQKNVKESACAVCHDDVHEGKFGDQCAKCHQESSFSDLKTMDFFDHSVTDFALEGKHEEVDCKDCHKGSFTDPMPFSNCIDCHSDYHDGQFTADQGVRDCAECHTVDGFDYSLYGPEQHAQTGFPLEGSHLATPCFACHLEEDKWVFKDLGHDCVSCHDNIHEGLIDEKFYPEKDCRNCHNAESWAFIDFDHIETGWALEGKHQEVNCRECHFEESGDNKRQIFGELEAECYACHDDNHGGQFEIGGITDCICCHTSVNWRPSLFDHNTTAFPLDGKHAEVECKECHPLIIVDGEEIVKYKLESFECIDCHF